MLRPSTVDGTATAAISGRSAPSVTPGTGVSESNNWASSRPRPADAANSSAAPPPPSGQPGTGMRGHSIRSAPAFASR